MVNQKAFTLVELMTVVAIIGIISAIAYPNYMNYLKKGKRADMMAEMQKMASQIQAQKMVKGSFKNIRATDILKNNQYPQDKPLYNVTITPSPNLDVNWQITATPITTELMAQDGNMVVHADGRKCRKTCGMGEEWHKD